MSKLFTPYNLSGLALKNRVVMAPMTRTRTMNDVPDEVVALYYAQRASAGLLITEGMPVSEEGRGYLYTPGIYNDEHVQGWRKVTQAVHAKGGRIFAQLWHGFSGHRSGGQYHRFCADRIRRTGPGCTKPATRAGNA